MSHRWSCRNRHPAEIRPGVEPVPRRARVSPRSLPGLRSRRRLRRGAWAFGLERVNRPRRGGAQRGRKEIAVLLKVFFFFFFLLLFTLAGVSAGRRRR